MLIVCRIWFIKECGSMNDVVIQDKGAVRNCITNNIKLLYIWLVHVNEKVVFVENVKRARYFKLRL